MPSIQNWLASEGYMVGDIVTDEMLDFAWLALKSGIESLNLTKEQNTFAVKKIEKGKGTHKSTRKLAIELVVDYF